ncbi:PREDICTED: uncharacterized protein LOC109466336 [Branchiostoma belcheri]|uniref:Uncharacterized protein LOC109466336 n=1 Tax=Branchiostoma belcheri TaxID=7741 RepID=A0A6P4Y5A7_BRABE|nr:PREDICTED: uncharacterized protein LOC109466336 [Branchiostoma belcheri]
MRLPTLTALYVCCISCVCAESVYITAYGGFRYLKVRASGRMTSSNVKTTCEAAGYVTPCPSWSTCLHTSPDCTVASLTDCVRPMNDLAVPLCGAAPDACPQFYSVYIFMSNFNSGAACGVEHNWCANGNNYYNKYALCAEAAEGYLVSIGSWAFYKATVSGTMSAANIQSACAAGGAVTPCPGGSACGLPPSSCTVTSLASCGNPMSQLAAEVCGSNATSCRLLDGVYAITYDSNGKTCGVEAGDWCVDGSTRNNGFALCAREEEIYLASIGGWSFYKVRSSGQMSSDNVRLTCEAAGYVTSCSGDPTCQYTSSACAVTSLTDCDNPMNQVSAALCRTTPDLCAQLYGVYSFMHGWPGSLESAACGSENGRWCTVGTSYEDRYALCAKAVTSTHGFAVLRTKTLTFHGYKFLAIEARLSEDGQSHSETGAVIISICVRITI